MLKIRLQRIGKKKQAFFRFVVQDHSKKTTGKYLDCLGSWNPHTDEIKADKDKVKYWLSVGVLMTPTVHNLFIEARVIEGPKVTSWKPKKKEGGAINHDIGVVKPSEEKITPVQPEA